MIENYRNYAIKYIFFNFIYLFCNKTEPNLAENISDLTNKNKYKCQ